MERKIGEVFECNGIRLIVEKESSFCKGCYFNDFKSCFKYKPIIGHCQSASRSNGGVIFKKVKDNNEENNKSIIAEAEEIVNGSRQSDYGDARESFSRIATIASVMTGKEISPEDCCAVMMAVKLVRESFNHKRDNLVDLCGYAELMNRLKE